MAHVASDLYGTNLLHFLDEMGGAANYKIDHENDAVRPALVLEDGEKTWPPPPIEEGRSAAGTPKPPKPRRPPKPAPPRPPSVADGHGVTARRRARRRATAGIVIACVGLVAAAVWLCLRYGHADAIALDRRRSSCSSTSPCSCWRASSASRSCGT